MITEKNYQYRKRNWFSRLGIRQKISFGYALAIGIAVLGTLAGLTIGDYYQKQAVREGDIARKQEKLLINLKSAVLETGYHQQHLVSNVGTKSFEHEYAHFRGYLRKTARIFRELNAVEGESGNKPHELKLKELLQQYNGIESSYLRSLQAVLKRIDAFDLPPNRVTEAQKELLKFNNSQIAGELDRIAHELTGLIEIAQKEEIEADAALHRAENWRVLIIGMSTLLASLTAAALAVYISQAIASPLETATKTARQVSDSNNFNLQVPVTTSDEVGQMSEALNQMLQRVATYTQELQKSEEHFRLLVEGVKDYSLVMIDPKGYIISWNSGSERITGYQEREIIGQHFSCFFRREDIEQGKPEQELQIVTQLGSYEDEGWRVRKDSTWFWAHSVVTALRDETGELKGFAKLMRDITQRKSAEQALRLMQEQMQYLLSSSPAVIYSCKPVGDYGATFISDNVATIFGYQAPEFLQESGFWANHIHPEDAPRVFANLPRLFEQGHHIHEYRFLHKNGTYRWVSDELKLIRDSAGNPLEIVGCMSDVTDRVQAEIELRRALEKEKELVELKSRFITTASHEFRTPLATILASAGLIEAFGHKFSEEKKLHHLHKIQNQVKRMTQLLEDVLFIGKAEAGRIEFAPAPINLEEFCREILEEIALTDDKKHALNFECRGECSLATLDEKLLRTMLANLLSNALKYSPQGGNVSLNLNCENGQAIFQVKDSGIGIPASDRERLFETFHRASNVGTIPGTGLGLSIIKKAVELHKGSIAVESEEGVGTRFTVCVPTKH